MAGTGNAGQGDWAAIDRLVRWRLTRFKESPLWDDLYSESVLSAWENLRRPAACAFSTRVIRACDDAVSRFLRQEQKERGSTVSLAELVEDGFEYSRLWLPDETPRLIDRLAGRDILEWMLRHSRGRARAALRSVYLEGRTTQETAAELGVHLDSVQKDLDGLRRRCRAAFGIEPEKRVRRPGSPKTAREREQWNRYMQRYRRRAAGKGTGHGGMAI